MNARSSLFNALWQGAHSGCYEISVIASAPQHSDTQHVKPQSVKLSHSDRFTSLMIHEACKISREKHSRILNSCLGLKKKVILLDAYNFRSDVQ
jgi:hypothetical protein